MTSGTTSTRLRRRLVVDLEQHSLIQTKPVRDAFLSVPRELFVPDFAAREGVTAVYRDQAIMTKAGEYGQPLSSSSQPGIMALMLEQLDLEQGMHVLEIGAGTGYNAALLSLLVGGKGRVVSVDVDAEVAAGARRALRVGGYRARVVCADGRDGYPKGAPYDRIVVTASAEAVPRPWFDQLAGDGLLQVPLRLSATGAQAIPILRKTRAGFRSVRAVAGGFMPLRDAGDEGRGPPPREPALIVTDLSGDGPDGLFSLAGEALRTLAQPAKRRLIATAAGEPRRRPLGLRADHGALALYLSLTVSRARLVTMSPIFKLGAIGRDGRSLAVIELGQPDRPRIDTLEAYGGDEAETFLLERAREWARRGRPAASDLELAVTYTDGRSRISARWPPTAPGYPPLRPPMSFERPTKKSSKTRAIPTTETLS